MKGVVSALKKKSMLKIISCLLVIAYLFIALAGTLSGGKLFFFSSKNAMQAGPFSFADLVKQDSVFIPANVVKPLMIEEKRGESLTKLRLFGVILYSPKNIDVFYASFYKYLMAFFIIMLFILITIIWKQDKDGKKRAYSSTKSLKHRRSILV